MTVDNKPFHDIQQFKTLLLREKGLISTCLTEKLLVYGTGRKIGFSDRDAVQQIVKDVTNQGSGLKTLIHEIIQSDLFIRP